jgi:hypothetical protein
MLSSAVADFESVEKVVKKCTKKVISKNMSKSEKSAYFRHVFADNYFCVHLKKTFSA